MLPSFGLKVWSNNLNYINLAAALFNEGIYDYIEIYALPDTKDTVSSWKALNIPFIVHAPHFAHGLNFSDKYKYQSNLKMAREALGFADKLNATTVIFHPGIKGDFRETARQIKSIKDERIVIENKPYKIALVMKGLKEHDICVGYSPEEIKYIMLTAGVGFCFDIGHGICSANGQGLDKMDYIRKFMQLNPKMFHLSDGDWNGYVDKHYNIGKGTYNFKAISELLHGSPKISVETRKTYIDNLADFKEDIIKLRNIFKETEMILD